MQTFTRLSILTVAAFAFFTLGCAPDRVSVGLAVAPICPYGYYEVPPYACAPDGYYGPEWFSGDVFIGAGPWYRGPRRFYGHVDHNFDFRQGYRGPLPARGDRPVGNRAPFRGQAMHDPRGREAPAGRR
ncbi:MAG: hypothetical protein ABSG41_00390 [Bryobacteraceae bacterium]|jgi:hypothetical protein